MSETRWTDGPWSCVRKHPHVWAIDAPGGDIDLGHVKWHSLADVYGCDDMEEVGSEKARANAHLIAAAPELYEALDKLKSSYEALAHDYEYAVGAGDIHPLHAEHIQRCAAVLAKARGEQP